MKIKFLFFYYTLIFFSSLFYFYFSEINENNEIFFHNHKMNEYSHIINGNRKNLFSIDDTKLKINLCISVPAFLEYGGIEYWIKSFLFIIKKINLEKNIPIKVYGIHIWDLNTNSLFELFQKEKIEYIYNYQDLENYCDIIINTASWIVKNPNIINIMVIHGDNQDKWTNNYATMHYLNDFVISVSNFKFNQTNKNTKYINIPTLIIKREENENYKYRFCKNQLLYVGRISEEKRSNLICEYICYNNQIPLNTCAIFLGDYYFSENKPKCNCKNVFYLGFRNDINSFMKNSDFLLVPSKSEGGPIVAIEAWQNNLPVIMKKTGLANIYPDSFILYDWDKFDKNELTNLINIEKNNNLNIIKKNMNFTFSKYFSEEVLFF